MMQCSPICLLSKASKTKSWLWHRRLSHQNFRYTNELVKQGLVRGLPKLKYQKDHLYFVCYLGKSKKHTHNPKSDDSIQEKLYLLHMDLCGSIRIESISGKSTFWLLLMTTGYAPAKKAYRIYNRRTYLIMETIHVEFDEMTMMAPEQFGSRPELQLMTHRTISSGLVQNLPFLTPYVPPTKNDWDLLFQPMFNDYVNPPPSVVSLVPAAATSRPVDSTDSPSSTSIDQVAPSVSTSSTIQETQSLVISEGVKEQLQLTQLVDDPFLDILTSKPSSQESSSTVQPANPPFEHISKCMKIHPLENVIANPSRPFLTRKLLQTDAMWCFFDAFLTSVELKNFKEALLESS
ncbi:integrase, catalytic region, zinc finger, CCHC-type containing protein [Tanacetum coccineum]